MLGYTHMSSTKPTMRQLALRIINILRHSGQNSGELKTLENDLVLYAG